jgi:hypothetical protein
MSGVFKSSGEYVGIWGEKLRNPIILTAPNIEKSIELAARGSMVVDDGFVQIGVIAAAKLGIIRALVLGVGTEGLFRDHDCWQLDS